MNPQGDLPPRGPVAGIHGGGTRTSCLVFVPAAGRLGEGSGGPLNTNYVHVETVEVSLAAALSGASARAGVDPAALTCVAAAAPWSERAVEEVATRLAPAARVLVPGEDAVALLGGTLEPHGLVLIAGTGSRCAYIPPEGAGEAVVAGAWGSLFGDEGSGYDIGRRALQAVTRSWDGRGPATAMSDKLTSRWGLAAHKDLVHHVYGAASGGWRERIASVCFIVGEAAAAGDPLACEILEQAADELSLLVEAVATRARLPRPVRVLVSGGVFSLGDAIIDRLRARLARGDLAHVVLPVFPPVAGALLAAARAAELDTAAGSPVMRALASHYRRDAGGKPGGRVGYNEEPERTGGG